MNSEGWVIQDIGFAKQYQGKGYLTALILLLLFHPKYGKDQLRIIDLTNLSFKQRLYNSKLWEWHPRRNRDDEVDAERPGWMCSFSIKKADVENAGFNVFEPRDPPRFITDVCPWTVWKLQNDPGPAPPKQ